MSLRNQGFPDFQDMYSVDDFGDALRYTQAMAAYNRGIARFGTVEEAEREVARNNEGQVLDAFSRLMVFGAAEVLAYMQSKGLSDPGGFVRGAAETGRVDFGNPAWPNGVQVLLTHLDASLAFDVSRGSTGPSIIRDLVEVFEAYTLVTAQPLPLIETGSEASYPDYPAASEQLGPARPAEPRSIRLRPRVLLRTRLGGPRGFGGPVRPRSRGAELARTAMDMARRRGARDIVLETLMILSYLYVIAFGPLRNHGGGAGAGWWNPSSPMFPM
eukprot:tig00000459_g1147.t1